MSDWRAGGWMGGWVETEAGLRDFYVHYKKGFTKTISGKIKLNSIHICVKTEKWFN